jgi:hypothetical protein
MSLQNESQRGDMARQVLENEVYAEAYTLLEAEITRAWRESRDQAEREELHRALRSLSKVKTVLESTMKSGQVALDKLRRNAAACSGLGTTSSAPRDAGIPRKPGVPRHWPRIAGKRVAWRVWRREGAPRRRVRGDHERWREASAVS